MPDGWRNRFLAPVYALVISFMFVVILGAALHDPTRIQFTIDEESRSSELPEGFWDFRVRVDTDDGKKKLRDEPLGGSSEFTLLIADKYIRICTRPPNGWVAEAANAVPGPNGDSCWDRDGRGEDVEITLRRQLA